MGKKSGHGGEKKKQQQPEARVFGLRVAMHCDCDGCADKIRAAVKDLTLHSGVEAVDQTALASKGEVTVLATADPERLRQRVRKATGKAVDLLLPKEPKPADKQQQANAAAAKQQQADAAAQAATLLNSYGQHQGAWANQLRAAGWNAQGANYGGGYGAAQAYPWAVQQQVAVDPYAAYSGAYPAAAGTWGPYGAYPAAAQQGYGGGGAWSGY